MNQGRPCVRLLRPAVALATIALSATVLAGCQSLQNLRDFAFGSPPPRASRAVMPPAVDPVLREIPLGEVTVEKPEPPQPKAPQVATVQRPPPRAPAVPAKKPPPPAPKEEVATVAPGELVGSDFTSVLQVLRKPDLVQNSALSVVWTYSQPACTLQLFFYPDIQTKIFRLLKYDLKSDAGEKTADRSACLHDIMAVKSDEPAIP
jgi:hypothetical protein